MKHLIDAGADEVICSQDYGLGLISQCALNPGMSKVYSRLLTYSIDTCEFYTIDELEIIEAFEGNSFEDISRWFLEHRNEVNPIILVRIIRKGEVLLNPRKHHMTEKELSFEGLKKRDALLVMC